MASESRKLLPKAGKPSENLVIGDAAHDRFPKTALKKHRPSYVTRLRDWAGSLLDAKPYEVRESWGTTTWHLSKRLFTLTILVGAISLGIIQQSFDISKRSIGQTFQLNEDVQLAVFGLLNTALALMVRDSLSHIADTVVTMWMISGHGASPLDFEMYDESIKPWVAVANVHARRKNGGWKVSDGLRFAVCAVTGVCLLLQGASMNTIGMPKLRWWPDTRFIKVDVHDDRLFFEMNMLQVANVSYMSVWERGFQTIKQGGGVSWELAHAIGAVSTFGAFETIHDTFNQLPGWSFASKQESLIRNAVNVTATSSPSIQSISIYGKTVVDIWDEQRKTSKYAGIRRSHGWEARLNLNGILLDTRCQKTSEHPVMLWKAMDHSNGTISVHVGPATAFDKTFPGATCSITISQALIEVTHWIIRDAIDGDKPGYSIDDYGKTRYPAMHHLPASTGDADIGKQISDWFNAILPNLQSLSSREDVLNLTSLVTQLANVIVKLDKGHTTTDGLSIVLSTIFSNFLTTFHWTFTEIPNETTKHGPVRWQIYGSGPRLPWQWLSAAVIAVSIVVQLVDIFCVLWHRSMKGHWLSLGGMLVAANAAERMDSVAEDQGAGFLREKDKFVRYYLSRKVSGDGAAKATLVDDDGLGNGYGRLKEGEKYGDVERH